MTKKLARGLGWFSLALGLSELLAPALLARFLGTPRRARVVRAFGAREIAAGLGILAGARLAPWIWSRVAGDALDLTALGLAIARGDNRRNAIIATGAVAGVTALDIWAGARLAAEAA